MIVRAAVELDLDKVLALIRATPELPQWKREALAEAVATSGNGPRRHLLVAEEHGALVGFAQISVLFGEAELESMAIREDTRRKGVGKLLLTDALDVARDGGAEVLRLEVRSGNIAAQRLYRSAGLAITGIRRGYYRDPQEDAVLMEFRW